MTDLLRSGATMLQDHCPQCNSPLFRVGKDVLCPRCNRRVIIVKEGEEQLVAASSLLDDVEKTILLKIQEVNQQLKGEKDLANLEKLINLLVKWLEALERMRRIKKF